MERKRVKMLNKVKNEESIIMMFFVVALIGIGSVVYLKRSLIDVIYFAVLLFYFLKFLIIKSK